MPELINNAESNQQAASVLKLFEHERRISVVEKDVERNSHEVSSLAKDVYGLPATIRDLIDTRARDIQVDANNKFDKITEKLGTFSWYMVALLGGLVVDMIVHFLPHF